MGTEVMHPQDLLARRIRPAPPPAIPRRKPPRAARQGRSPDAAARRPRILKRGEELPEVYGTGRLGPDPAAVPKPYAGSGFSVSPSPSALPMPSFPRREEPQGVNRSATMDLLRILRLG